jgi:hypothetical protein
MGLSGYAMGGPGMNSKQGGWQNYYDPKGGFLGQHFNHPQSKALSTFDKATEALIAYLVGGAAMGAAGGPTMPGIRRRGPAGAGAATARGMCCPRRWAALRILPSWVLVLRLTALPQVERTSSAATACLPASPIRGLSAARDGARRALARCGRGRRGWAWRFLLRPAASGAGGLLGPAATLLGALGGAKGQTGIETMTHDLPPEMKGYVYGEGGLMPGAMGLFQQQTAPGAMPGYAQMRNVGMGLLQQPMAGNGFAQFQQRPRFGG